MKLRFVNQLESNDCGPACLSMVAGFYGKRISLKKVKEYCSVTRMGVSVKDILNGGRSMGLDSHGLKLTIDQLEEIPLPCILYWKQDHFIVLYKIKIIRGTKYYFLADPGYGKIKVVSDIISKEWIGNNLKGVCLVFQPSENFIEEKKKVDLYSKITSLTKGELLLQLKEFIGRNKFKYLLSFVLLIIGLASNWIIPIIFQKIIDDGIIAKSLNLVVVLLLSQLLLFIGYFCSQLFSDLIITRFNLRLSILLKENFLKKLIRLPVNYFDTRLNTDTLTRLSDLNTVQSFLTWKGVSFIINMLNLVVFSLILLSLDTMVFIVFLILSVLSIIWVAFFLKKRASIEYSMFIRQSDNSNNLFEFIMNMPEIKVNQAQYTVISRITAIQEKLNELELRSLYLNMFQLSGANFILKFKEIAIIAYCAYLIINTNMTIGTLLSISYILGQLNGPIINLINNIRDAQDAKIANKRIEDVYGVPDEVSNCLNFKAFKMEQLSVQNITFKYPGSFNPFVITNLSFEIPKDKLTAIVGVSGSGKTTLMKLLMKYYDPVVGDIMIGNVNFKQIDPDEWRSRCGVVLQDGHIFSGTIKYNIALCDDDAVDVEQLKKSLEVSCLNEFVDSLPMGFNTKIGNVGTQLSGGQKQRILIARAVYKNPEFLFFDEATSSLDANTEKAIMNNLDDFFNGRTVVVVAHRLSTVKNANQILVMDKGELVEIGSHQDLVSRRDKYYSLVQNQLELGT